MGENNISRVVDAGCCIGCGRCMICGHITFEKNKLGVSLPVVGPDCIQCGQCLLACGNLP